MSLLQTLVSWYFQIIGFICSFYLFFLCLCPLLVFMIIKSLLMKRYSEVKDDKEIKVGIFHPYCNAGAGGERVLWFFVKALQAKYEKVHVFIYTGDLDHDRETILANVETVFGLKMQGNISIVYLHRRKYVEAKMYPYCTLLGQSIGSIYLGWEALSIFKPDIFIDTMGYAFTYPLFKYFGGCKVASYTHYPMISSDMLQVVSNRTTAVNNNQTISSSSILTAGKLGYYKGIAFLYGLAGRTADIVMVNSSWTKDHIDAIWNCPQRTHLLYPPCDVEKLLQLPLLSQEEKNHEIRMVSVSQFRPEKNHALMIRVIKKLTTIIDEDILKKVRLVLIGSCRHEEDESYVQKLKNLAENLNVSNFIEFKINIPYLQLTAEMQKGTIGIHAMWNEHFGISVVDGLAAGLIMVANASGGPKADIIITKDKTRNGFLAKDISEYTQTIASIINMTEGERDAIRLAARKSVSRFSTEGFERNLVEIIAPFFNNKER